jgi:hypothetical protein
MIFYFKYIFIFRANKEELNKMINDDEIMLYIKYYYTKNRETNKNIYIW